MGLNYQLIKRTTNTTTSDVVHSSGYAKRQNGGSFGVSSNTTFSERQQIDQNRKIVQSYEDSKIGRGEVVRQTALAEKQEQAMTAAWRAIAQGKNAFKDDGRREFNVLREQGGLQRYDTRKDTSNINRTARGGESINRGGTTRQEAAARRQAMADRFAAKAHPAPKTGGFRH